MAQDVSVNKVNLLKTYNAQIKTFNTSVNTVLAIFRRKIEGIIHETKSRLNREERNYNVAKQRISDKISKVESIISEHNWDSDARARLETELSRLRDLRNKLDSLFFTVKQDHATLTLQLNDLINSANTFALSNQSLLNSNVSRMNTVIGHIDDYKANSL